MKRIDGLELSPASARVAPYRAAMFHTTSPSNGTLQGVLVGARPNDEEPWVPAVELVTIDAVIVHGVHVPIALGLLEPERMGWRLWARPVRAGQTIVVFVRNRTARVAELRAVMVVGPSMLAAAG